jgi:hypothetical protein
VTAAIGALPAIVVIVVVAVAVRVASRLRD